MSPMCPDTSVTYVPGSDHPRFLQAVERVMKSDRADSAGSNRGGGPPTGRKSRIRSVRTYPDPFARVGDPGLFPIPPQ